MNRYCDTRGEFNNASARRALVDWYLSLFIMCKAGHQYNERPRALALSNLPLVVIINIHDYDNYPDLESRSMRDNLMFYGIPESDGEEDCELLVKKLCDEHLKMASDALMFDRVHRVGVKKRNAHRLFRRKRGCEKGIIRVGGNIETAQRRRRNAMATAGERGEKSIIPGNEQREEW